MSEKELLEAIGSHTKSINSWFSRVNPFMLGKESREAYQPLADTVRTLTMDVRVALRNYDKVMTERVEDKKRIKELEDKLNFLQNVDPINKKPLDDFKYILINGNDQQNEVA